MFGSLGVEFQQSSDGGGGWQPPADWPLMPTSVADHIDILVAVTNNDSNFCAVNVTVVGGYTVDWGDGTIENVASATQRDHQYTYATLGTAVTSRGYKTAIIMIYPQAANPITAFDIGVKNATSGLAAYSNPWLDIQINAPSCTLMAYRSGVEQKWVERINIIAIGALTSLNSMFINSSALQSITFPAGSLASLTTMASTFQGCVALSAIVFPAGSLSLVTSIANAFSGCSSLQSVFFPAGSLAAVTSLAGAFQTCSVLKYIEFPAGALNVTSTLANAFLACAALQSITFPDGSLDLVTTMASTFSGCASLNAIFFPAGAFPLLVTTTTTFTSCTNLEKIVNCSIPVSFTLPCNLAAAQLNEIYTSLPIVVGQTITVTGNWGTATDTPAIATGKGWTVTG